MQTTKMSLANIQGKLSRTEMKNIMAGVDLAPIGGENKICKCTDSHSAGIVSCDTCDSYCQNHGHGSQVTCGD